MYKISKINLTQREEVEPYISLAKKILFEFKELSKMYDEIAIIAAYKQHCEDESINGIIAKFLGLSNQDIIYTRDGDKPAHCAIIGTKACIVIVVDLFEVFPQWKQAFVVRHECCHLLHGPSYSPTLESLCKKYAQDWLASLVAYRSDYQADLCVIKRYLDDWLRDPVGIPKGTMSPRSFYRRERKMRGVRNAILIGISNSVRVLQIIYLQQYLLTIPQLPSQLKEHHKQNLKRYEGYLDSWWRCLQKDVDCRLPSPREWLRREHFENEEIFFKRISQLLATIGI